MRAAPALAFVVCFLATGCSPDLKRDRFESIRVGDDAMIVQAALGEPEERLRSEWFYDDLDNHRSAIIYFDGAGRVSGKEWMDSKRGVWEGANPNANPPPGEVIEERRTTITIDDD